jgi:two-component system, cell cycle sensor histidine kinase and response regulator CckA
MLKTLEDSARRGANLVQQILSFARGVEGERVPLTIGPLLTEIEKMLEETLPRSIEIHCDIAADLWPIEGDATRLHQVLMNLCVNARDAIGDRGNLWIRAHNQHLDASLARRHLAAQVGNYVVITIEDNGCGMKPEVLDRIFDPFFTTKAMGQGTGLGLSAVLGIVNSHGGFITVVSQPQQGSTFAIYLPATLSPLPPMHPIEAPPSQGKKLVLVVDDENTISDTVRMMLEVQGHRVLVAANGPEAQALARTHPEISCALVDLMMPQQDALDTFTELHHILPRVPLVAMSGLRNGQLLQRLQRVGCRGFLAKPFTVSELLAVLQEAIGE